MVVNWISTTILCCLFFFQAVAEAQASKAETPSERLSLEAYLGQIRTGNQNFVGSAKIAEGAELRANEGLLLTRPSLIGSANNVEDQRESGSAIQGDEISARNYSLGLRQRTNFGLDARFLYNYSFQSLPQANRNFIPQREVYTAGPVLELTQALGRNGLGKEVRASQQLLSAQARATLYTERFRQQQMIAQAESIYWRMVVAREAVEATRDTVQRSERLRSWSQQRQKLNLGNRSDFLQAEAAHLARSLELQNALDEERAAARAFNTFRGIDSDDVPESLASFEASIVNGMKAPERGTSRDDVKAAEQQKLATLANQQLSVERNKPVLNLVGTYGWNGRDVDSQEAIHEASTEARPHYTIGIQLDMPLDFGTASDTRRGYLLEAEAADIHYRRKVFEEDRLWKDLNKQFTDAISRYRLALKIEGAQKEKLENERTRHNRGLTTTFQVIQFEQDFANAQLARLRSQADVINVFAQLKTFGGGT